MCSPERNRRYAGQTLQVCRLPIASDAANQRFRSPDCYHSCYSLTGLSAMQHGHSFEVTSNGSNTVSDHAFNWALDESALPSTDQFFDKEDMLEPLHPIFTIPYLAVKDFRHQALSKEGFWRERKVWDEEEEVCVVFRAPISFHQGISSNKRDLPAEIDWLEESVETIPKKPQRDLCTLIITWR